MAGNVNLVIGARGRRLLVWPLDRARATVAEAALSNMDASAFQLGPSMTSAGSCGAFAAPYRKVKPR